MKDEARIQAAIGILARILAAGDAADRALQAWGRAHRFAGSKDRRAIAEHVYAALRSGAAGPGVDARAAMIAGLRDAGLDAARVEALFSGAEHAPPPLTQDERARLGAAPAPPPWLVRSLRRRFGAGMDAEMAALKARAPLDLRVNTLKAAPEQAMAALAEDGIVAEPFGRCATALRVVAGSVDVESCTAWRGGLVEIQDAGSQIVCALADARPGMAVLDLCAGGGGKSLALAAAMGNEGRVLATDIAPVRLKRLKPRAARAGATIVETRLLPDGWLEQGFPAAETFDRVVVDAPCSGSGTWRRNPETRLRLTPARLAELAALQGRLLDAAAALVRPGGLLLYITCSVLPEEGEDAVEAFLARTRGLGLDRPPLHLSPAATQTDGFFAALFRKS